MADKPDQEKLNQLQIFEQNMQQVSSQKQKYQAQMMELENALSELEKEKEKVYKIAGEIMFLTESEDVKKDLNSKKEIIGLRIKNLEKQETNIREKVQKLQEEIMKEMNKNKKNE